MDLSTLKDVLGVRDVRIAPGQQLDQPDQDSSLVAEIFARHRNSKQPESQQLCIILSAILEVIKAEGMQPTPTALFAALMASLEKPDTQAAPEIAAGVCNLLTQVLPRVPNSVLKSKYGPASQLLLTLLDSKGSEVTIARTALPSLVQILAGARPSDWITTAPAFTAILRGCLDPRPKVRKKAQSGLVEVLAAFQGSTAINNSASEAVLKLCQQVLPAPEAAARAAAAAPGKKRQQAEEAITAAVTDALHLIGALKQCVSLISSTAVAGISELLLALYPLNQPLLSKGATDILSVLCASPTSHLSAKGLSALLQAVLAGDNTISLTNAKDADGALGFIRLIESATSRLNDVDATACSAVLPHAVHSLVPLLASQHDTVRVSTGNALCSLLADCITDQDIATAVNGGTTSRAPTSLQRTIAAIESSLGPRFQDAWEDALTVAAAAIEVLGRKGAPLAEGLIARIGSLCAGADAAAEEGEPDEHLALAAQSALGVALRAVGPETVLEILPLGLQEGLDGSGEEARTWLLPLMRQHVRGGELMYWGKDLLELARQMGTRAAQAERVEARRKEAKVCSVLENQIWATLPSFCSWATDIGAVLPELSTTLSKAFQKRPELRVIICNALQRIASQTRSAMKHHGHPIGHSDPSNVKEEDADIGLDEVAHVEVPSTFTLKMAQSNVSALQTAATTWLPILLDAFVSSPTEKRTQIEAAVSAYACVCDPSVLAGPFRAAITKMIEAAQQSETDDYLPGPGGDTPTERRCTYMEAALSLAGGLPEDALVVLYKAAAQAATVKDPAVQKKAYKTLAYLCEARPEFLEARFKDVLQTLLGGVTTAMSAAKRYRLRSLKAAILRLTRPGAAPLDLGDMSELGIVLPPAMGTEDLDQNAVQARQIVAAMVSEIVLCVKEANKRTRSEAYTLLVEVAAAMHEADPPPATAFGMGDVSDDEDMGPSTSMGSSSDDEDRMPSHIGKRKNIGMPTGARGTAAVGRTDQGGLHALFTMVLGGLVGSTPHMISASVMALARLLYDFAPVLTGLVPDLLPAVLMLLRSKAREVIKSVLGFVKVVAVRLPVEELTRFIPSILEGILLWAEDSKNKFRLKVRVIIERLARRCGFEALAPHMPEAHRALLTHIRKQKVRSEKRRAESQMDWEGDDDEEDARSRRSGAKTAKTGRTRWTDAVFDSDDDEKTTRSAKTGKTGNTRRDFGAGRSVRSAKTTTGARLPSNGDPVDLLDASTSKRLGQAAAGKRRAAAAGTAVAKDDDFAVDKQGRLVIREEEDKVPKRKRRSEWDSDDSDYEDLKGYTGTELAVRGSKSMAMAASIAASIGGKSLGAKSMGGKSLGGKSLGGKSYRSEGGRTTNTAAGRDGKKSHTGDRFKPKKGKAGGDVKGKSKVEPYAYWPLDRKLLNRRQAKAKGAQVGLDKIVNAAAEGAAKGRKAKRMKRG